MTKNEHTNFTLHGNLVQGRSLTSHLTLGLYNQLDIGKRDSI